MPRTSVIKYIKQMNRPVFSTRELSGVSGKSPSAVTQALNHLEKHGVVKKLYRGVWAETAPAPLSPYALIPHLFGGARVYVSFLSALRLHGIIEQIPQDITLASTSHTKKVKTAYGVFVVHQIAPEFFFGFDWHKGTGGFLVAEPEKALADSLYLFTRKKKQYGHFPELNLKKPFDTAKAKKYINRIPDENARKSALMKFEEVLRQNE
ncbi:MAG: type IV toxin-antitoxin system AbiEi family antitoxin domain-containing protein [Endomicrobiales bacterium]|nr:type IV toxin-antitoxin system AbiEi family antitoxin domain-containing protein [Endomicrobiales bacterium]